MSSLAVSVYSPEHVHNLVRMWRAGFERGVGIKDLPPLEGQLGYFHEKVLPNRRVRMAWQDETLVRFLAAKQESVAQMDARLGYQREGMGSHKLPLILPLAKRDPASSLWLYTFEQMAVATRFYECHGFTAVEFGFEPNWLLADVKYQWVKGVIGAFDR